MRHKLIYIFSLLVLVLGGVMTLDFVSERNQYKKRIATTNVQISRVSTQNKKASSDISQAHYTDKNSHATALTLNKFFSAMYGYDNGKEYLVKRQAALKLIDSHQISTTVINKLYSTGLDSAGSNMVEKLGQKSELAGIEIFNGEGVASPISVLVHFKVQNNSSDLRSGHVWYQVKVNQAIQKISDIVKIGRVDNL